MRWAEILWGKEREGSCAGSGQRSAFSNATSAAGLEGGRGTRAEGSRGAVRNLLQLSCRSQGQGQAWGSGNGAPLSASLQESG